MKDAVKDAQKQRADYETQLKEFESQTEQDTGRRSEVSQHEARSRRTNSNQWRAFLSPPPHARSLNKSSK